MPEDRSILAKMDDAGRYLTLPAHCLDVALVFRAICDIPGIRRMLDLLAGAPLTEGQRDRLAFLAGMHDLGKAHRGFQAKLWSRRRIPVSHIRELAILYGSSYTNPSVQAALRSLLRGALPSDFETWFAHPASGFAYQMATFSHHGTPLTLDSRDSHPSLEEWWASGDPGDPFRGIRDITAWLSRSLPHLHDPLTPHLPENPPFLHRFAGLVTLADWIASNVQWFPLSGTVAWASRDNYDRRTIPRVLTDIGIDARAWQDQLTLSPTNPFAQLFGWAAPRPLQSQILALDPRDPSHQTLILEAETGSGKTEAALAWGAVLFSAGLVDGLYFALPTRVAATELYRRVTRYVQRWFPTSAPVVVCAVPGYESSSSGPLADSNRLVDPEYDRHWAAERPKRFLAATIAVGTIDQILVAGLEARHAHLRLALLHRHLLIIDEVHASDAYMTKILSHVLDAHRAAGGYALLLSATLGSSARQHFLPKSSAPLSLNDAAQFAYPCITTGNGETQRIPDTGRSKTIEWRMLPLTLSRTDHAFDPVIAVIAQGIQRGAHILVILNTVSRVRALQHALENSGILPPDAFLHVRGHIVMHHGRFAPEDRRVLDAAVSQAFGPQRAQGPLVLVGTQTLEQSLDLDADLLITDLAPADVLLQRLGRLHRHDRRRPADYRTAQAVILVPEVSFDALVQTTHWLHAARSWGYATVYPDLRIIALTQRWIAQHPTITLPRDNRRIVEATTHPDALKILSGTYWQSHGYSVQGQLIAQQQEATDRLLRLDKTFGTFTFASSHSGSTRLGLHDLWVSFDTPVISPFNEPIHHLVIPGHIAQRTKLLTDADTVKIAAVDPTPDGFRVDVKTKTARATFHYSRYGLT